MNKQEILEALKYIGIEPSDIHLKNEHFKCPIVGGGREKYHGIGHIYRVMIGTALLAKEIHEPRFGKLAFFAAMLHDLGRVNDGHDFGHGLRSANECFAQFEDLWKKYRFSLFEREMIRAAAANHAPHDNHNYHGAWIVDSLVCDADALDRCRFRGGARLNPNFLKHRVSHDYINKINELCVPTYRWVNDISLLDFIDIATSNNAMVETATETVVVNAYQRPYTPDCITSLAPNEIFVFGSNIHGAHGGGAAAFAMRRFGAVWGEGEGLTGQCYALPTMEGGVDYIQEKVNKFLDYARQHPDKKFLVTPIACGIAGFRPEEIGPLFKNALPMENVILPKSFVDVLLG